MPGNSKVDLATVDIEDANGLLRYLRETGWIEAGESPSLCTLRGGVSNKTILLQRPDGSRWVLKQALPKLRVQADWFSNPDRIHVEADALRYLPRITPPNSTPRLLFEDRKQHVLAMEAVPAPHMNWKEQLLSGNLDRDLFAQFGRLLGAIHGRSHELRAEFANIFGNRVFFETLRLEPYYQFSAERVPEAKPFLFTVIEENRSHEVALVHGDYSPKNILVHRDRLVLLDHEVVHFGDPAFDLGFSLTHFLSKALHLEAYRAEFLAAALYYWETYLDETNAAAWFEGVERRAARNTAGCLLARTAGRSPLEYLSDEERGKHREAALRLIADCPATVPDLIDRFGQTISE